MIEAELDHKKNKIILKCGTGWMFDATNKKINK